MPTPILTTKIYVPPPRTKVVVRADLIARLNAGVQRKLTLISAPAGFGKTTLVSEWAAQCQQPVAWLSLDEGDSDPTRFLIYLVATLQTMLARQTPPSTFGIGVMNALQSLQPPPPEAILTALLNDINTLPSHFIIVLDDYHVIDAKPVDQALTFLIEHLPPHMHLIITTREDPHLPLARLRARGQLTELRIADLCFNISEATGFLNQVMGLNLAPAEVVALETRTEGWIAGLQLAAISLQGHSDTSQFIKSFSGNHQFVLDYLVEEVLQQQPEHLQTFLLQTSILNRLCGPLCDAVLQSSVGFGQNTLAYIERSNLFIVPLDNERRWYRYHHLFAELLRQRLQQSIATAAPDQRIEIAELHNRASLWYETNGLEIEAFHHATAAHNISRAAHLIEGKGMPLQFRGAVRPILNWLASLPPAVLDTTPTLWVVYASALLVIGQVVGVEEKVKAAEATLQTMGMAQNHDFIGRIASIRATVALTQHNVAEIIAQSRLALQYLPTHNHPSRASVIWNLGYAYHLQGDRAAAKQAYVEALANSQAIGLTTIAMMALIGLGYLYENENQLTLAAEFYQRALKLVGDPPPPPICDAHLGLARIFYEWNNLDAAERHGQLSLPLARQIENTDRAVNCEIFIARLKLAQGDITGASNMLTMAEQFARQQQFMQRLPDIAAAQVLVWLRQGDIGAAQTLAQTYNLPTSRAQVHLAQKDTTSALTVLAAWRKHIETKGWADELLKTIVLQAIAHDAHGETAQALQRLTEAITLAAPSGHLRIFLNEGPPMATLLMTLLTSLNTDETLKSYIHQLLKAFAASNESQRQISAASLLPSPPPTPQPLIEALSQREREVLQLIAQGLSNQEISKRLFVALSTVKGHNQVIFSKLQVERRTEAVARARELGLL